MHLAGSLEDASEHEGRRPEVFGDPTASRRIEIPAFGARHEGKECVWIDRTNSVARVQLGAEEVDHTLAEVIKFGVATHGKG